MRILFIDDDLTFLTVYKKILEKNILPGDEILISQKPSESIANLKDQPVDVVISDLVMPDMSGLEVLQKVKEIDSSIEVIVITGQGSIDAAVEAMRLGARDFLTKPVNHGVLLEKIQNIREFIERIQEVEDYRFAKETIESNAMRTVADMEIKLDRYINLVDDLKAIIADNQNNDKKISLILTEIENLEEEI